ncbi:MAG: DMT family transporter [Cohaesibacteraceae bacterium]
MTPSSSQTRPAPATRGASSDAPLERYDYALYIVTCFVWGTSWLGLRMQLGTVAPEVSIVWRFALASLLVFAWAAWSKQRLHFGWREHVLFAAMGFFLFSTNFLLFYNGGLVITAGLLAVVFSLASIVNFIIGIAFMGQKADPRRLGGAVLGACGIGFLFWPEIVGTTFNQAVFVGLGLCVMGTLSFCVGNVLSARAQRQALPILSTNAWGMLYGTVWMTFLVLVQGHAFVIEPTVSYLGSLLWLAVFSSVIAFWSYLTLLGRIGGARAAYATVIFPLIALASSTLFEGYQWTIFAVIGVVLALAGNWLVLGGGKRQLVNKGG